MGKLYTPYSWYRCCAVECKDKLDDYILDNIIFYNESGEVAKVGQGHFDNNEILEFKGEVIYRNKVNFERQENFVVKSKDSSLFVDKRYILYIYINNVDLKYKGLIKDDGCVYKQYNVNGIDFKVFDLKDKIKREIEKITVYDLPMEDKELSIICRNIKRYNSEIREQQEFIKNYIPCESDYEDM